MKGLLDKRVNYTTVLTESGIGHDCGHSLTDGVHGHVHSAAVGVLHGAGGHDIIIAGTHDHILTAAGHQVTGGQGQVLDLAASGSCD